MAVPVRCIVRGENWGFGLIQGLGIAGIAGLTGCSDGYCLCASLLGDCALAALIAKIIIVNAIDKKRISAILIGFMLPCRENMMQVLDLFMMEY